MWEKKIPFQPGFVVSHFWAAMQFAPLFRPRLVVCKRLEATAIQALERVTVFTYAEPADFDHYADNERSPCLLGIYAPDTNAEVEHWFAEFAAAGEKGIPRICFLSNAHHKSYIEEATKRNCWDDAEGCVVANFDDATDLYEALMLTAYHIFPVQEGEAHLIRSTKKFLSDYENATTQLRSGALRVNPIFGVPQDDAQFWCDIFMVMPFIEALDVIYQEHIKPALMAKGLVIKRGDDFFSKHEIMDEIWSSIHHSKLVIADVTGKNANVFYELGIAHTLGKSAIMISQSMDDVPFDVRGKRVIVYENTAAGLDRLIAQLTAAVDAIMSEADSDD